MVTGRILKLTAALTVFGMVGCDNARTVEETTEQEIFTEPTTETVEVEVMAEDTFLVERTTEVEVDTTEVDTEDLREDDRVVAPR